MKYEERKEKMLKAREHNCAICGKKIYVPDADRWVYAVTDRRTNRKTYYCSWGHMRKAETKGGHQKADMPDRA